MKRIQVLGPGCPKCDQLAKRVETAVRELGIEAVVQRVTDIAAILDFDVLMTPALVVDGVVQRVGDVPPVEDIKKLLS